MPIPQRKPGKQARRHLLRLDDGELSDLIDCVAAAADRAASSAYAVATTPAAKRLALDRAKRLYALADRLLGIDEGRQ